MWKALLFVVCWSNAAIALSPFVLHLVGRPASVEAGELPGLIAPPLSPAIEARRKCPTADELPQTEPKFDAFRITHPDPWISVPLRHLAVDRIHYALSN